MIRIDFPEQDLSRIKKLRYDHPHPRVRKRMDVLWLKSQGLPHEAICRLTDICGNTLRKVLRRYQCGGLESVMALNFYAPTSELEQHRARLQAHFRQHPPATIKEAMARLFNFGSESGDLFMQFSCRVSGLPGGVRASRVRDACRPTAAHQWCVPRPWPRG